jgi:hypothetical protein
MTNVLIEDNFTAGLYLVTFDSEDTHLFNWTFVFQNCEFKNLYGYYSLFYIDEIEMIFHIFKNDTFENIATYIAPFNVE